MIRFRLRLILVYLWLILEIVPEEDVILREQIELVRTMMQIKLRREEKQ